MIPTNIYLANSKTIRENRIKEVQLCDPIWTKEFDYSLEGVRESHANKTENSDEKVKDIVGKALHNLKKCVQNAQ
jgi:hypothetical protein